jgi:uncharacterized protein YjaZ
MVQTLLMIFVVACIANHAVVEAFVGPAKSSDWHVGQTDSSRLNAATMSRGIDGDLILKTDANSPYLLFPGGG